jgi:hypothetical protein
MAAKPPRLPATSPAETALTAKSRRSTNQLNNAAGMAWTSVATSDSIGVAAFSGVAVSE